MQRYRCACTHTLTCTRGTNGQDTRGNLFTNKEVHHAGSTHPHLHSPSSAWSLMCSPLHMHGPSRAPPSRAWPLTCMVTHVHGPSRACPFTCTVPHMHHPHMHHPHLHDPSCARSLMCSQFHVHSPSRAPILTCNAPHLHGPSRACTLKCTTFTCTPLHMHGPSHAPPSHTPSSPA